MENGRRGFLTAAAAFAAGAVLVDGTADAATVPVTLLNGDGPPRARLGVVGDFYINDIAHTIYGPKRAHGWGEPTSLIGPRGAAGPAGAPGTASATGAEGEPGEEGPPGPRGYSVLNGSGPPASSLGEDNDFYIDTATTQLYGPKTGGAWGSPVSLTGQANINVIDGGSL